METVKLGLIGCGATLAMYSPGMKYLKHAVMAAAADVNPQALERAGVVFPGIRTYQSVEAMLQAGALDAVIVASPPFEHLQHVQAGAEKKLAVLCEKPMARTVAEARAMIDACRSAGVPLAVAFNRRHLSAIYTARRLIEQGELGEVFAVECNWTSWTGQHSCGWRDSADCLGGCFQDHGAHTIDLAMQWLGPVKNVACQALQVGAKLGVQRGVDDHMSALLVHENGCTSTHVHSRVSHRAVSEFYRLLGTKGTLEIEYTGDWSYLAADEWELRLYRGGNYRPMRMRSQRPDAELWDELRDGAYGYYRELADFVELVRTGEHARVARGEDGLRVVEAVAACYVAAAQQQMVHVSAGAKLDATLFAKSVHKL